MQILLGKKKNFYKANLHCHSTESDGRRSPEELKEEYKKRGYSVVAFTDHEHLIDNSHLDDENFLTITSCELAIKQFPLESTLKNRDMHVCHLNFYALDPHNVTTPCYSSVCDHYVRDENRDRIRFEGEYERVYSAEVINDMIREGQRKGFIVSYNHPSWSLEDAENYMKYEGLFAVEIYNHSCAMSGHPEDERVFAEMLRVGKRVFCTAADDNHNPVSFTAPGSDSFGGFVEIDADALEYGEIMRALQSGDFYASTGPRITRLTREGNTVRIVTSPVCRIHLLTRGRRTEKAFAVGEDGLTEATFTLHDTDGFFRLRIEDAEGKRAYTQAYPV